MGIRGRRMNKFMEMAIAEARIGIKKVMVDLLARLLLKTTKLLQEHIIKFLKNVMQLLMAKLKQYEKLQEN